MWRPAAFLTVVAASIAAPALADPMVRTSAGTVQGVTLHGTSRFLGIPFAAAPVGPLRWQAPQPPARWQGTRKAQAPAPACYQGAPRQFGPYTPEFLIEGPVSEDCLYLNVWTPAKTHGKLPVLVYIHGGGFGSGSGTIPIYDGTGLARRGAIVVTINYRLGVFGFLAHPDLSREGAGTSGNYGLLDMIAALRWVRANIGAFGGDAGNVTIAGQSAGAAAVNDLVLSPLAQGLFERAIAQSGSGMGIGIATLAQAERNGMAFADRAGVTGIAALRALDAATLQRLSDRPPPGAGGAARASSIGFAPNLDGRVIAADPENGASKPVASVSFMTGFAADEGLAFGTPDTPAAFDAYVTTKFGEFAGRILALYPHTDAAQVAGSIRLLARDRYMASMAMWAEKRSALSARPIYAYLFDHPYPAANGKSFGAFHTADVPYVMGALRLGGRSFTRADDVVSARVQNHWLAFMRTGDPSIPNGQWTPATPAAAPVMTIGSGAGMQPAVSSPARYAALRDFVQAGGRLTLF